MDEPIVIKQHSGRIGPKYPYVIGIQFYSSISSSINT